MLGLVDNKLVGVAAIRDNQHCYHLFVAPEYHKKGIAGLLWQYLKAEAVATGTVSFTVNSSIYAVPVYEKFGFNETQGLQMVNDIRFVSMALIPLAMHCKRA